MLMCGDSHFVTINQSRRVRFTQIVNLSKGADHVVLATFQQICLDVAGTYPNVTAGENKVFPVVAKALKPRPITVFTARFS
jgi:hypothetical protein